MTTMQLKRSIAFAGLLAILLAVAGRANAENSVSLEQVIRDAVIGEDLGFSLLFQLDDDQTTVDCSEITLDGTPIEPIIESQGRRSSRIVINGRIVEDSAGPQLRYKFLLPTREPGRYTVGPADIRIGDKTQTLPRMTFTVTEPPTSDDLVLRTEIVNPQRRYYPTQVIEVLCKLYHRNLRDVKFSKISLPMLDDPRLQYIEQDGNVEVTIGRKTYRLDIERGNGQLQGRRFNTFAFKLKLRLLKPGDLDFVNTIKISHVNGYTTRRDFFGRPTRVGKREDLYAISKLATEVQALPTENVPPSFNGAIGNFSISATPSSDTDVRVGDPITLSIEIAGNGAWDFVQCPPLHRLPEITDYFKISSDSVAGEVSADGSRKTFLVRMRVKTKTIEQIPPISFTFFETNEQVYKTIHSEPVPITVYEGGNSATIVDYSDQPTEQDQPVEVKAIEHADASSESEVAEIEKIEIGDSVPVPEATLLANDAPQFTRLLYAALPLIGVLFAFLGRLISKTSPSAEKLRRIRIKQAYPNFLRSCHELERGGDEDDFYRELGRSIRQFNCDRFSIDSDLDARLAEQIVGDGRLSESQGQALLSLIEEVDQQRYSQEKFDRDRGMTLLSRAKEVLQKC